METCQLGPCGPWGRLGSVLGAIAYAACAALRAYFAISAASSQSAQRHDPQSFDPRFGISSDRRCAPATTRPQTYPRVRADLHPKKVNNLGPMATAPVKNSFTRGPPVVAVAVSSDPYYPNDSQLQVYDIYIIRRVLFAAHARDVNILSGPRVSPSIMEQMIASWSMVMVHGLMVAGPCLSQIER